MEIDGKFLEQAMAIIGSKKAWSNLKGKPKKSDREKDAYFYRDELLKELGFSSYKHYLKSDIWKLIRDWQISKFPVCRTCRQKASEVHHVRYDMDTLIGAGHINVISLCRKCHKECEFQLGDKTSLWTANGILMKASQTENIKSLLSESVFIQPSRGLTYRKQTYAQQIRSKKRTDRQEKRLQRINASFHKAARMTP